MKKVFASAGLLTSIFVAATPAQAANYYYFTTVPGLESCERTNSVLEFLNMGSGEVVYRQITCCNGDSHYGGEAFTAWSTSYVVDTCQN